MDDLIGEFIGETSESLAALERALGDASRPMSAESWDMAVKLMHTITGTCGFLHLPKMEALAERTKQQLETLRDRGGDPGEDQRRALHDSLAEIKTMMQHLAAHGSETPPPLKPATAAAATPATAAAPSTPPASATEPVPEATPASFTLPPPPPNAANAALAIRAEEPRPEAPPSERVSFNTMATLVNLRNQLSDMTRVKADARITAAEGTLQGLIESLRDKILPRARESFPRIDRVLLVYSGGLRMAIAQSGILGTARINDSERTGDIEEGALLSLRGEWLPRLSLARRMAQVGAAAEAYAVMIEQRGIRVALCVEQLGALEEVVVQEVPSLLRASPLYEGAVVLGDGTPCMLLDVAALLAERSVKPVSAPAAAPASQPLPARSVTAAKPAAAAPADVTPETPRKAAPPPATRQPFLLFTDNTPMQKAIPLTQVARVEHTGASDVVRGANGYEAKVRGEMLQLQLLPGATLPSHGDFPLILLLDAPHTALVAHRVGGILDAAIALPQSDTLVLTTAELDGEPTDIINAASFLPPAKKEAAHV